jgi:excisionase family DNA binding protein
MPRVEVSTGAAARLLGVSQPTIRRMCEDGTLKARRDPHSGYWRIDYQSLDEYRNQTVNALR